MYELLVSLKYPLRDPDSTLYEAISVGLQQRPWIEWLAPLWPVHRAKSGLFVEHFPFFFWPAAALGCIGLERGALLANFGYFLGCLYLLFRIARSLLQTEGAWLAVALYVVSPLGIKYLVGANQENAWALGFLGALYCLRQPSRAGPAIGFVLFAVFAFLIKGALALSLFPVLGLWWWWSSARPGKLLWFAAALGAMVAVSLAYEWVYRGLTGESFFAGYAAAQLSYVQRDEGIGWTRKLINPLYYAANLLWFALPSSVAALYGFYRARRRGMKASEAEQLAGLCIASSFVLAVPIARRAMRYIFPIYSLIHLPAAQQVCNTAPKVRAWLAKEGQHLSYALMLLLLVVLAARVVIDLHFYRFVQVF
jgi:hypothetical protein